MSLTWSLAIWEASWRAAGSRVTCWPVLYRAPRVEEAKKDLDWRNFKPSPMHQPRKNFHKIPIPSITMSNTGKRSLSPQFSGAQESSSVMSSSKRPHLDQPNAVAASYAQQPTAPSRPQQNRISAFGVHPLHRFKGPCARYQQPTEIGYFSYDEERQLHLMDDSKLVSC